MKIQQFIHEYKGFEGKDSHCRVSIYGAINGETVAIASELPTNPGTPVIEFAEHLATQIYRILFPPSGTDIEQFMYVEHSPPSLGETEYTFNRVDFDWDEGGLQFINPERTTMTPEEVRALVDDEL